MTIKYPLAAALLMTASAALANPLLTGTAPLGNGGIAQGGTFSLVPDDGMFTCSSPTLPHIPYASCTSDQLSARAKWNGMCSRDNKACVDYIIRLGGNTTAAVGNTVTCGVVPYLPCKTDKPAPAQEPTEMEEIVVTGRRPAQPHQQRVPVPGDDDFIGPVRPQDLPPAIAPFKDDEEYKAALKTQQQATPNAKIIEMGDGRFAVLSEDGQTASMNGRCGGGPCSGAPKPVSSIPGLQAKINESKKADAFTMNSQDNSKSVPTKDEAAADQPDPDGSARPTGNPSARNVGFEAGNDIAQNGGGGSFSPTPGSGGATGTTKVLAATAEMRAKMTVAGYSYTRVGKAAEDSMSIIQGGAAALTNSNGRSDDLHLDGRPAGMQAVANDGSAK